MMKRVLLCACCFAGSASASVITPSEYVRAVIAASPEIQQAQESLRSSRNAYGSLVIDSSLPQLTLAMDAPLYGHNDGAYRGFRLDRNEITSSANLSWNIFNGGQDRYAIKSARYSVDIAELNLKTRKQAAALSAFSAYYGLLLADKLLVVAVKDETDQDKQYTLSKELYENGLQSLADLLQSETNWRSSQLRRAQAAANYQLALTTFNNLINRSLLEPTELEDIKPLSIAAGSVPKLEQDINKALSSRFEMLSAVLALRSSEAAYMQTLLANTPTARVDFNWAKSGLGMFSLPSSGVEPNPEYQLGLSVSVPIGFFWLSQRKKIDSADAGRKSAAQGIETVKRTVNNEVVSARINIELKMKLLELAALKVKISKEKLDLVQEQYKQGLADGIKLTQAQKDDLDAQTEYASALCQEALNRFQYRKSVGEQLW